MSSALRQKVWRQSPKWAQIIWINIRDICQTPKRPQHTAFSLLIHNVCHWVGFSWRCLDFLTFEICTLVVIKMCREFTLLVLHSDKGEFSDYTQIIYLKNCSLWPLQVEGRYYVFYHSKNELRTFTWSPNLSWQKKKSSLMLLKVKNENLVTCLLDLPAVTLLVVTLVISPKALLCSPNPTAFNATFFPAILRPAWPPCCPGTMFSWST